MPGERGDHCCCAVSRAGTTLNPQPSFSAMGEDTYAGELEVSTLTSSNEAACLPGRLAKWVHQEGSRLDLSKDFLPRKLGVWQRLSPAVFQLVSSSQLPCVMD